MTNYCPNCGTEIPEGAAFCPSCGQAVSREVAQHQEPREASSQTGATEQRPEPSQVQEQPVSTPPPAARTGISGSGTPRRGLLLGGIAVASVLGFLTILIVGAVVFLFIFGGASEADPPPNDPPPSEQEPSQPPTSEPPESEPTPNKGSLDELVQQQVGDFTLQKTGEWTEAIQAGATQALQMEYASPDGTTLVHFVAAYGSPEQANQNLDAGVDLLISEEGFQKVDETPLEDDQGQQFGKAVLLQKEIEGEPLKAVLWTNDNLEVRTAGPRETALDFFEKSRY